MRARMIVSSGVSPARWNSGSSLPMISLVQRNSRPQSDRGTPRSHEITPIGSGAATRSTKSNSPASFGRDQLVENLDGDAVDLRKAGTDRARREAPDRDPPHRSVLRGIDRDDHLGRWIRRALRAHEEPVRAREERRLRRDVGDVGVLRDRPERLEAGRIEERDRRLRPQPRPHVVRIPVAREARRLDEIERVDGDGLDDHATTPRTLRSTTVSQSSPRSARIASPCSLKSGARPGTAGSSSYCTGAATSSNGVPDAVLHCWM